MDSYSLVPFHTSLLRKKSSLNIASIKVEALLTCSRMTEFSTEFRHITAKLLNQFREHTFSPITKSEKNVINQYLNVPEKIIEFMDRVVGREMPEFYINEAWKLLLEIYDGTILTEEPSCFYTQFDEFLDRDEEVNFRWGSISCHIGDRNISLYIYQRGEEATLSKELSFPLTLEGRIQAAQCIRNAVNNIPNFDTYSKEGSKDEVQSDIQKSVVL